MNSPEELKKAAAEGETLVWNDPDPIEGGDYTIQSFTIKTPRKPTHFSRGMNWHKFKNNYNFS